MTSPSPSAQPFSDPPWVNQPSPFYKESHHRLRKWALKWVETHVPEKAAARWEAEGVRDEAVFQQAGKDGILLAFAAGVRIDPKWVEWTGIQPPAGIKAEEWDHFHDFVLCDSILTVGAGSVFMGL